MGNPILNSYHLTCFFGMLALAACSSAENVSPPHSATPTPPATRNTLYVSAVPQTPPPQNPVVYALSGTTGQLLWNYADGDNVDGPPVLDHGVLYVGSDTSVYALNAQGGRLLWRYPTLAAAQVIGVVHGTIYVGSFTDIPDGPGSAVYALNASNGSLIWRYTTTDIVYPGVLLDGVIYATAVKSHCQCSTFLSYTLALRASDGSVRWKTPAKTRWYDVQLVANGLLYGEDGVPVDEAFNFLQVLSASDGSVKWRFPATPSALVSIIGLDSSAIYALSKDGNAETNPAVVYALNPTTGAVLWRSAVQGPAVQGAATPGATLSGGTIYVGSGDGSVTALQTADGKRAWHTQVGQTGTLIDGSPAIATVVNGRVYVSFDQGFAALSASDGSVQWRYKASGVQSIAAVINGVVYAHSSDDVTTHHGDKIYALNAADGALLWRYDSPTTISTPVVG